MWRYKSWYRDTHAGGFDYYLEWPGFNLPVWVLKAFSSKLRPQEEALLYLVPKSAGYVIGSCEKDVKTLQHELAHGLYATNASYQRQAQQCLTELPKGRVDASRRVLLKLGRAPKDLKSGANRLYLYLVYDLYLYPILIGY